MLIPLRHENIQGIHAPQRKMREPFSGFGKVAALWICHSVWGIAIFIPGRFANFSAQSVFLRCKGRS
jgi:hypothetical protein